VWWCGVVVLCGGVVLWCGGVIFCVVLWCCGVVVVWRHLTPHARKWLITGSPFYITAIHAGA